LNSISSATSRARGRTARQSGPTNPQPLFNYTEAFRAGELAFAAGQVATDFKTGIAMEAAGNPAFPYDGCAIEKQTRYILNNLRMTFEAAGSSLDHVVKAQVFLTDLNDFWAFDQVWKEFFKNPPRRNTIGIPGLLRGFTRQRRSIRKRTADPPGITMALGDRIRYPQSVTKFF
jgi:enamine deaminase RidA (YjgF/YER057c/UK114 family)